MPQQRGWGNLLILLLFTAASIACLRPSFPNRFPPLSVSLSSPTTRLRDFNGIGLGLRRLAADLAWIETLQYYGTREAGQTEEEFENGQGKYPDFLAYCERVARLDPSFTYVYFYGGGVLAWNLDRLAEGEVLLKLGVQNNPHEWRLQQYLGALAFQKNHDVKRLAEFLESYVDDPDCPNLLRSILANIYKKEKRYPDSLRIWFKVLDTKDPAYRDRASQQIEELAPLAGLSAPKAPLNAPK